MIALFLLLAIAQCFGLQSIRTYSFVVQPTSVSFGESLPTHTQLFNTWPSNSTLLPDAIRATSIVDGNDNDDGQGTLILMGPVIHVSSGDRLELTLTNHLPQTGISIHLHGLAFGSAFEYAGDVGISQCPLAEGLSFTYNVTIDSRPGTYWYHTSSLAAGHFGSYDAIRGPLIVHPGDRNVLVNSLNTLPLSSPKRGLAYGNERIMFFQDGLLSNPATRYSQHVGGFDPPPSKNEGITISTSPFHFGTMNGKLREIVHVKPGQRYLFRVINGGQHHALRFSIDGFPLTVVSIDSQPVQPYSVDAVVLHVGERFDCELFVFGDLDEGELFWIRADTLEATPQGFQNGIRAIMRVSSETQTFQLEDEILDPPQNIATPVLIGSDVQTLNCHRGPGCVPITALSPSINQADPSDIDDSTSGSEIHTVDTSANPVPQYGHFVSIDDSVPTQNEFPPGAMISRMYRSSSYSMHPHSMALRVPRASSAIIIWRNTMLMDVPMHIHGHEVEILDVATPELNKDCNLLSCKLSEAFDGKEKLLRLDAIPPSQSISKDTFVIPAGGAIATRLHTSHRRSLWMVNGQRDVHEEDGISFVLIVGDYRIGDDDNWPSDFPSCNTTLVKAITPKPYCDCHVDKDAPLQPEIQEKKLCSRDHLCRHELSQPATLSSYVYESGFAVQAQGGGPVIPTSLVAILFVVVVFVSIILVMVLPPIRHSYSSNENEDPAHEQSKYGQVLRRISSLGIGTRQRLRSNIDINIESSGDETSGPESMLGFSVITGTVDQLQETYHHIGTVTEKIHEDDEEEDGYDGSDNECGPDVPPPPSSRPTHSLISSKARSSQSTKTILSKSTLPPLPPPQRLNSQISTSDFFSFRNNRRRSTLSTTFERIFHERSGDDRAKTELKEAFDFILDGFSVQGKVDITPVDENIVHNKCSFRKQFLYLFPIQWQLYVPSCVNLLRLVEVVGLASMTGLVFADVGSNNTQATVSELSSLVMVLAIMWTFSRLYSSVMLGHEWWKSTRVVLELRRFSLLPVFIARLAVVMLCESFFPMITVFISFPIAGLVGDVRSLCNCAFLLTYHNMCCISLGTALGMFCRNASHGMVAATIFGQLAILVSGVLIKLPDSATWARSLSPFYWVMKGLLKSVYHWSDTFECISSSSSEVPPNQCFLEFDGLIDQYNQRDLNVAKYDDSSSDTVLKEGLSLIALTISLWLLIFCKCMFAFHKLQMFDILAILGDFMDAILSGG